MSSETSFMSSETSFYVFLDKFYVFRDKFYIFRDKFYVFHELTNEVVSFVGATLAVALARVKAYSPHKGDRKGRPYERT